MSADLLLAEELALVAIDPDKGRATIGHGQYLNAALAGLLIAELVIDGALVEGKKEGTVEATGHAPEDPVLAAAAGVVADKGPKIKSALSGMDRGLKKTLGQGTWETMTLGLVEAEAIGVEDGGLRSHHEVLDAQRRNLIVRRLQEAAAGDGPLEPRTAVVLSMTGPARLLEVVSPTKDGRKHAKKRIDGCLDDSGLADVGRLVRKVIQETQNAAAAGAIAGGVAASSS